MLKLALLGTLLALASCLPLNNEVGPYADYNPFGQNQQIALVDDQNQPLGYLYSVKSQAVKLQKENLLPVRDSNGNIFAYYSLNQFKEGQKWVPQEPDDKVVTQLKVFGVIYRPPKDGVRATLVFLNPSVLENSVNGVLRFGNSFNQQPDQYSQYPQQYGFNYGPEDQYRRPYYQQFQGPYAYQYQGPYAYPYQGPFAYPYQGPYAYPYQGPFAYPYQGPYGYYGYQQFGPYNYQPYRGNVYGNPFNYNQYVPPY